MLFAASRDDNRELWRTDGTEAGTHYVTAFEGVVRLGGALHVMNGVAYYGVQTGARSQLWRTDGTTAGSWLVAEIPTGGPYGEITLGQVYRDQLYFVALDPAGRELWVSDGTAAGTHRFADLQQGTGSSSPSDLTVFNDRLFFTAVTDAYGSEVWVSDGTEAGTQVLDLAPGPAYGTRAVGPAAGGQLFLWVSSSAHLGLDLWTTDGTLAGTHLVRELENASILSAHEGAIAAGDRIFFRAHDGDGGQLWVSDGTEAGTHLVADAWPGEYSGIDEMLGYYDGYIFFAATDETHGSELWASDGTEAGTVLLADLMPGTEGSDPTSLRCLNDALYFTAEDLAHGRELFVLPGVDCGCHPPATRNDALTLSEDTSAAADVLFNDTDIDRLEVSVAVPPAHGTVAVEGRRLVYTPAPNYHGPDSLTYLAVDTNGDTCPGTLTIEVLPVNDAPLAQADTAEGVYGQSLAIQVLANDSDVEGDPLSLVAVGPPAYGSVVAAGAVITYESGVGYVSTDTFTYTVSDGVLTATASVTVRLAPPGDWTFLPLLAQPPDGP